MERRMLTRLEKYWTESGRGDEQGYMGKEDLQSYRRAYMMGKARGKEEDGLAMEGDKVTDLVLSEKFIRSILVATVVITGHLAILLSQHHLYVIGLAQILQAHNIRHDPDSSIHNYSNHNFILFDSKIDLFWS